MHVREAWQHMHQCTRLGACTLVLASMAEAVSVSAWM